MLKKVQYIKRYIIKWVTESVRLSMSKAKSMRHDIFMNLIIIINFKFQKESFKAPKN